MEVIHQIGNLTEKIGIKKYVLICYDWYIEWKSYINYLKYKKKDALFVSQNPVPQIFSIDETLDYLIATHKSVCRYGDGEFNLIQNHSIGFQTASAQLSERLAEILCTPTDNLLVCIPGIFTMPAVYTKKTRNFWNRILVCDRPKWYRHLNFDYHYGNADITRCYIGIEDKTASRKYFEKLISLWEDKNVLLIEGQQSRLGVGNDLFQNVRSLKRILCPALNAFSYYDEIRNASLKHAENADIILLALGPTATVLAYDLSVCGKRVLDIGNVDNEYDWFRAGAKKKIRNPLKFSMEVKNGGHTEPCLDETYLSQIAEVIV